MTEEKDADWMLSNLNASEFTSIIATQASSPRSMTAELLSEIAREFCNHVITKPDPKDALIEALSASSEEDIIFGTGSMYVVGAIREASHKLKFEQN